MVNSMTGFGRGSITKGNRTFTVEMKSVNHRFQEISIKLPRAFISLEDKIRNFVCNKIKRGKVDIYISQKDYSKEGTEVVLNLELAQNYLNCLKKIGSHFGLRDDVTVGNISRFPEVLTLEQKEEDLDEIWKLIQEPLKEALDNLILMRGVEGEKLKDDVLVKVNHIKNLVDNIKKRAPLVVDDYKNKLELRLKDLLEDKENYDEARVAMEIAIFADKASIDEEITRLYSHIEQVKKTLKIQDSIGRKLDFIIQEMNREANTIASKANDLEILNNTLELKSEIEKMREQVQNIE